MQITGPVIDPYLFLSKFRKNTKVPAVIPVYGKNAKYIKLLYSVTKDEELSTDELTQYTDWQELAIINKPQTIEQYDLDKDGYIDIQPLFLFNSDIYSALLAKIPQELNWVVLRYEESDADGNLNKSQVFLYHFDRTKKGLK